MNRSVTRWASVLVLATVGPIVVGCWLDGMAMPVYGSAAQGGPLNQLTDAEKNAGWKLLFDGKSMAGWHNFKQKGVREGWQVKDDAVVCVNPAKAGDIVTSDAYNWFELSIDFNISEGGNSGIMFHVTDEGKTTWATGPEIQLLDNAKGKDAQRCGWLYQLYKPANDPKTNQPLDATKPAGQWNTLRFVLAPPPAQSSVEMNGVKYYDFVFNSDDWKDRVNKSKFRKEANFAKSDAGFIALQGDHGSVSFRNIKLRPIAAAASDKK
jgi:hypothetical protein